MPPCSRPGSCLSTANDWCVWQMLIALQEDWDRDWRDSGFHREWDNSRNSFKHQTLLHEKHKEWTHFIVWNTAFHYSSLHVKTLLFSTAGWRTRKSASKSGHRPTMPAFVHSLHLMIERKDTFTTSSLHYSNSVFSQCPKSFLKSLYTIFQNAASTAQSGTGRREYISPIWTSLFIGSQLNPK